MQREKLAVLGWVERELMANKFFIEIELDLDEEFKRTGHYRKLSQENEILYKVTRLLNEFQKIRSRDSNTF